MKVLWLLKLTAQVKFQFCFRKRKATWAVRWPTHLRGGPHTGLSEYFWSTCVAEKERGGLAGRVTEGQESCSWTLGGNCSGVSDPDNDAHTPKRFFLPVILDYDLKLCTWGIQSLGYPAGRRSMLLGYQQGRCTHTHTHTRANLMFFLIDPWPGSIPHALGQQSPCVTTTEPTLPRAQEPQLLTPKHLETLCSTAGEATAISPRTASRVAQARRN